MNILIVILIGLFYFLFGFLIAKGLDYFFSKRRKEKVIIKTTREERRREELRDIYNE